VNGRDHVDVRLATALSEGRLEVFDQFVDHFRTRIFQYSFLMCGVREDAEEVAQDTLLKVFENFASLREPEKVRSWVFRIAKNACLMKRRRSIFAPQQELSLEHYMRETGDDGSTHERHIAGDSVLPDAIVYEHEMRQALTRAIRALPPDYRAVILLRDLEELTTEEAADILEISTDAVKQRLHRARKALRKEMEEYEHV
jgi:RNA polymerase sigma-70 factor (ECF subfamily)